MLVKPYLRLGGNDFLQTEGNYKMEIRKCAFLNDFGLRHLCYAAQGLLIVLMCCHSLMAQKASQSRRYEVCGNPQMACPNGLAGGESGEGAIPIMIPGELEWMGEYRSKPFYVVIIQSRKVIRKSHPAQDDYVCGGQFSSTERARVQQMFPQNRVFSSAFGCYHFEHWYTNVNTDFNFLAVYGGETETAAKRVLNEIKVKGNYPAANIRKMQAVFCNGCH